MTSLDYLKSRERNVNLGQQDTARKWNPYVTITLADNSEYPMKGFVDFADPQVDPNTGTFSVRAEMANPDRALLPGQITKVRLLLDVRGAYQGPGHREGRSLRLRLPSGQHSREEIYRARPRDRQ